MRQAVEYAVGEAGTGGGGGGGDGSTGPPGPTGPQGPMGPEGATGATGAGFEMSDTIAIGVDAGTTDQGLQGVAIGYRAGNLEQGERAIAIGANAAPTGQPTDSIVLNASADDLTPANQGFYVRPVRQNNAKMFNTYMPMGYDQDTNEVYCTPISADLFQPTVTGVRCTIQSGNMYGQIFGSMVNIWGSVECTLNAGATSANVQVPMPPNLFADIISVNLTPSGNNQLVNDFRTALHRPPALDGESYIIDYDIIVGNQMNPVNPVGYIVTVYLSVVGFLLEPL